MFEKTFDEMTAVVTVEPGVFSILGQSNVGLGSCGIKKGSNTYTSAEALEIIHKIDKLAPSAPKALYKRIRATRMSFALAFGPEMEEKLFVTAIF